jgi:hypothetical protein
MLALPAGEIERALFDTKVLRVCADDSTDSIAGVREIGKPLVWPVHRHVQVLLNGMLY